MKIIKSATNSCNIPANPRVSSIEAADDAEYTLQDRIKDLSSDIDYMIDGLGQVDEQTANGLLDKIEDTVQSFIQEIAEQIS